MASSSHIVCRTALGTAARLKMTIRGAVQGVGFRPFIYRLATELGLNGWVSNTAQGVFLEVEGPREKVESFLLRVEPERPPISFIQSLESTYADVVGYSDFQIRASEGGEKTALVMPDVATCPDCLREIFDPTNRRYLYPFTNCTNCGPRYTIIEALPYDRPNTSMKHFTMCEACEREYHDPMDRRFHAQPNACPVCGPHVELWSTSGVVLSRDGEALMRACDAIRRGEIVAVKGLGGFHLFADACNELAVQTLRERKHREEKPFALMYPSVEALRNDCEVTSLEERLLRSPESPIVLLRRKEFTGSMLALSLAPGNPMLGVMVPYTPLHHLLLSELGSPVIATSGNLSDEPICTDEHDALHRLKDIADVLLVHNRPIVRHVDDSIVRVVAGREMVMRRARGFAPLPVMLANDMPSALAVGAHQKNTIALSVGKQVFVSQHIGDLETEQANAAFRSVISSLEGLYDSTPTTVACDLHPNYVSTEQAHQLAEQPIGVQHHYAHVLSCMAENGVSAPVLGVAWDGSGWGPDGTVWGGEFLLVDDKGYRRVARMRPFRLAGGERAVREPRRCALGMLYEAFGETVLQKEEIGVIRSMSPNELNVMGTMLRKGLNAPQTSSIGRLFDAVSSLLGIRQIARFEGQGAMEVEWLAAGSSTAEHYPFVIADQDADAPADVDWAPMLDGILFDLSHRVLEETVARKFHNTLVEIIAAIAKRYEMPVALSGGCFQNRLLTELTVERLERDGVKVYWHQRVPPNDGGISLGQIVAASRAQQLQKSTR